MTMNVSKTSERAWPAATLRAILVSSIVGWVAIDVYMSAVYLIHGIPALRLFQWDASNIIGTSAYSGGYGAGALGLFFDLIVSLGWGTICVIAMNRIASARAHPVWFGAVFGAVVMFVMIWILVPIGRAPHGPMTLSNFLIVLGGHTLCFGIPMALSVRAVEGSA